MTFALGAVVAVIVSLLPSETHLGETSTITGEFGFGVRGRAAGPIAFRIAGSLVT
jgi:hypothetical protein